MDIASDPLEESIDSASHGAGRVLLLEGPAGSGKTQLLDVAAERAHDRGLRVLRAAGGELERSFLFGTAIALLEETWANADAGERGRLRSGPGRLAGMLLDGRLDGASLRSLGDLYPVIRACVAVLREIAQTGPLALVVDDVHAADQPSLRLLAYLAARIAPEPIVLFAAFGQGEKPSDAGALSDLRDRLTTRRLPMRPLTRREVEELVHAAVPNADAGCAAKVFSVTVGNRFLVGELLAQLVANTDAPELRTPARRRRPRPRSDRRLARGPARPNELA